MERKKIAMIAIVLLAAVALTALLSKGALSIPIPEGGSGCLGCWKIIGGIEYCLPCPSTSTSSTSTSIGTGPADPPVTPSSEICASLPSELTSVCISSGCPPTSTADNFGECKDGSSPTSVPCVAASGSGLYVHKDGYCIGANSVDSWASNNGWTYGCISDVCGCLVACALTGSDVSDSTGGQSSFTDLCTGVECKNPGTACKQETGTCAGGACSYADAYENSQDTAEPFLCDGLCCSGVCTTDKCTVGGDCAEISPSAGPGEESAPSMFSPDVECVFSSTSPRAYRHVCTSPGTCSATCASKTELGYAGFCQYCPYNLTGILSTQQVPYQAIFSFSRMPAMANYPMNALKFAETSGYANAGYSLPIWDVGCGDKKIDVAMPFGNGITVSFGGFSAINYSHAKIENFTRLSIPTVIRDPTMGDANGVAQSLYSKENVSALSAVEVSMSTDVKIADPSAALQVDYYNVTINFTEQDLPADDDTGERARFIGALDIFKCDSAFFLSGELCTGTWRNTSEVPGVILEKVVVPGSGGYLHASNYTSLSGLALAGPVNPAGFSCTADVECVTGCCGSPTSAGNRYCTQCAPMDCDPSLCDCAPLSPLCLIQPPESPWTNPVGCRTNADCDSCNFCANASIDPLINPYGPYQCVTCSGAKDGFCPSSACVGCDPDCCSTTADCGPLGTDPPYYCDNTTLDGSALLVGTCRACDASGNRDSYVPDPVCAGLEGDFCNATLSCTDANTYCACETEECLFGTCLARRGNFCETDDDCAANTYCSRTSHLCASSCFVSMAPSRMNAKLGSVKILRVVLNDPVGQERTYRIRIADSGAYSSGAPFASFLDGKKSIVVTVPKDGRKEVPIQFKAAALGKYSILVSAADTTYSGSAREGINSDQCSPGASAAEILVESEATNFRFLSAPGLGVLEMGVLVALAGAVFVLVDRVR